MGDNRCNDVLMNKYNQGIERNICFRIEGLAPWWG